LHLKFGTPTCDGKEYYGRLETATACSARSSLRWL
jgi:hypothetical protein